MATPSLGQEEAAGEENPAAPLPAEPRLEAEVTLTLTSLTPSHTISPLIYGVSWGDTALLESAAIPVRRWGGNATTRYNWQLDVSNRASDWFFENIPNEGVGQDPANLPHGSSSDRFVAQNQALGVETILTVPLIGWTPRERAKACGFAVSKYGQQAAVDPYDPDCGNGLALDGAPLTGNDPADTSRPIDPSFVVDWIEHLHEQFGPAGSGGVAYYNLDNEPMLWHHTHRDVHPEPVSYEDILTRTLAYAAAVKEADPAARTLGPAVWGWEAYFYSARDSAFRAENNWLRRPPDRQEHDDLPFIPWYLRELAAYEAAEGVRLLDYLDVHYYPQAAGVALSNDVSPEVRARRLRSTASLWDPSYRDESWIDEPVQLIPRLREWVDRYYPGTGIAIGEYNWGGLDHINGALAQADVLGIFGREGVDLALLWDPPAVDQPGAFALRMYLNVDGEGGHFGEESLPIVSSDSDLVSAFAARRTADGALTIMVVNKSERDIVTAFDLPEEAGGPARVFRYDETDLKAIRELPPLVLANPPHVITLPQNSLTLWIIER